MKKKYDAMVAGHVCLDITPRFADYEATSIGEILSPGKVINVGACEISTGGAVSNTGHTLHRLGHQVCLSACVGNDLFGEMVTGLLRKTGNADGIRAVPQQATSYSVVLAPPRIDRLFLHHPGANDSFASGDLEFERLCQCRHFHFGYPPLMKKMFIDRGTDLRRVFELAKQAGCITSCDMSLPDPDSESGKAPWLDILAAFLPFVDIFLPSAEEALFLLNKDSFMNLKKNNGSLPVSDQLTTEDVQRLAGQLLEMGTGIVVLKCGKKGIYLKSGDVTNISQIRHHTSLSSGQWASREIWCPAFAIDQIVSATGAGDAAIAGFLSAFMRDFTAEQCLKFACALGWENLHSYDAVSSIKTFPETEELLRGHLKIDRHPLNAAGWIWNQERQVWLASN